MRPKVVVGVLLTALALLGVVALVARLQRSTPAQLSADPAGPSKAPSSNTGTAGQISAARPAAEIPASAGTNAGATEAAHRNYVRQRIAELNRLAMRNDTGARDAILAELQNPDPQIRRGALEAAIQFGDRSVVPRLKEVAAATEDPAEKAAILEAVDYINLPSLTEYLAEQRSGAAASAATNGAEPATNQAGKRPRSPRPTPAAQP